MPCEFCLIHTELTRQTSESSRVGPSIDSVSARVGVHRQLSANVALTGPPQAGRGDADPRAQTPADPITKNHSTGAGHGAHRIRRATSAAPANG